MARRVFSTNLRCAGCLDTLRPHLDSLPGLDHWSVDLEAAGKPLTVDGPVSEALLAEAVSRAGYVLGPPRDVSDPISREAPASYYPLVLLLSIIVAAVLAGEWAAGSWHWHRAMRHFMAGFFLAFSFFKLLDLRGFAASFAMYDLLAGRWGGYGLLYPFLELGLGLAYLANLWPTAVNTATAIIMGVGTLGVLATMRSGRKVKCACLGTVINLPVATVTLLEDGGMALMAVAMLIW